MLWEVGAILFTDQQGQKVQVKKLKAFKTSNLS